jgi:hypothetical protein
MQVRLLRWLLATSGAVLIVAGLSLGAGWTVPLLGAAGLSLALVPSRRMRFWGALVLSLAGLYLRYTGHTPSAAAAVDWIRPRGMDIWPGLLQAGGMMVLLVTAPTVLSGGGGRVLRAIAGLGAVLCIAYWFFPQHFLIDELGPVEAGRSTMPVVVDGRVELRSWGRLGMPGTPIKVLSELIENEGRLTDIAHGMGHEAARLAGAQSGGRLRATLWGIQRAGSVVVIGAGALSMGVGVLVFAGLVRRWRAHRGLQQLAIWVLLTGLLCPPVLNLLLRGAGLIGGLPEAAADLPQAGALYATMLLSSMVGLLAGRSAQATVEP